MSDTFCRQCGVTDDQQAKCDDGCGVFCKECDEFIDVEENTKRQMNYGKRMPSTSNCSAAMSMWHSPVRGVGESLVPSRFGVELQSGHLSRQTRFL